jgi:predicted short-subunit dehydrogenase-like oxidoreductase (DUF2520 family)
MNLYWKKITLIGTGNVASHLGRLLVKQGFEIHQIYGRNAEKASQLAYEFNTESCNYTSVIKPDADLYIVALADSAIELIVNELSLKNKPIVHTAGSMPMDILQNASNQFGVFYPLQSLNEKTSYTPHIPFLVDANNEDLKNYLVQLGRKIGVSSTLCNNEQRKNFHLSAVFASNFTNYLYACAQDICEQHNIPFAVLYPLIQETAERIKANNPLQVQTGPAIRNDKAVMQLHQDLLKGDETKLEIYNLLSKAISKAAL